MRFSFGFAIGAWWVAGCASVDHTELRPDQKVARLMMLEDERSLGFGEVLTRLDDSSPQIQRRAALALGRIGAPESLAPLVALLSDPDADMRSTAAFSL